jgi:hypothetical protein
MMLLNLPVTTAVTAQVTPLFQVRAGSQSNPDTLQIQGTFTYGSGGTSADAWVQTSVDGGNSWIDIANFHFTTASAKFFYNLSPNTVISTQYTPTDGTLAANTSKDGIVGTMFRVKYTTVGTYAGGTVMRIDATTDGLATVP